jgi:hypothetical protein
VDTVQFRRRLGLEILIFTILVSLTALALRPVGTFTGSRMGMLRDSFIAGAESALNRKIRYASASPSIVGSLDIRNVSIFSEGQEPALKLDRFIARYSVVSLVMGRKDNVLRSVTIEGLQLVYDLDRDRDLAALFAQGDTGNGAFTLPEKCRFQVLNGSMLVKKGEKSLRVTDLAFGGSIKDGRITLDGTWHTEAALEGLAGSLTSVVVDGGLSGSFTRDFSDGGMILSISAVKADTFELGGLGFTVSVKDELLELWNTEKIFGLYLAYNLDTGVFSGEFAPDNAVLSRILEFTGDWKRYRPLLDLTLAGNASFITDPQDGLSYHFTMKGSGLQTVVTGFDLAGSGDSREIGFRRCGIAFRRGILEYTGTVRFDPLIPHGIMRFSGLGFAGGSGTAGLSGTLDLTRRGRGFNIFSENLFLGDFAVGEFSGGLSWENSGFSYALSLSRPGSGAPENGTAGLSLSGSYERESGGVKSGGPERMEGSLFLNGLYLSELAAMAEPFFEKETFFSGLKQAAGTVKITTEVFISTDFAHISYNAPYCDIITEGFSGLAALGSFSGTEQRFEFSNGQIKWKDEVVDLGLDADFSNPSNISFHAQTGYRDFTYYFEGTFFDNKTLNIKGSYGMSAYLGRDDLNGYSGYVDIAAIPFPFRGKMAHLTVDTAIRYISPSLWEVDINTVQFSDRENPALQFTEILISGQANQNGLDLDRLFYEDRFGKLSGSAGIAWEEAFSRVHGSLLLGSGTGEDYAAEAEFSFEGDASLEGSAEEGMAAFEVRVAGMQLDRFLASGANGRLSGTINGTWDTMDSYSVNVNLESLVLPGGKVPLDISAAGQVDAGRISVVSSRAGIGAMTVRAFVCVIDRVRSTLELSGRVEGMLGDSPVALDASVSADFAPLESWFGFDKALDAFAGKLNVSSALLNNMKLEEPCEFDFSKTMEKNGPALRVSGGPDDMLVFELLGDGSLYADLAFPSPIQANITGTLINGIIDATASGVYIDLAETWEFISLGHVVVFTSGFITGETRITGSLQDPEFYGKAWGSSVRLDFPDYMGAVIGPGSGNIVLEGNEITIGPVKAPCGNGMGEIGAVLRFNRGSSSYEISVAVPETMPIPFAFDIGGVKTAGDASGNLIFHVENSELLTIMGNVDIEDTEIILNTELLKITREETQADTSGSIDVASNVYIRAGRRVEFMWPNEDMPVLKAYSAAGTGVRIVSDSRQQTISLDGDISLQGGEIYYFQRSFFIREGKVFFSPNDPELDPHISTRAEIRDQNEEGPVVISMIIDYAPISSFLPRFESNPPLSQIEIYSLLGQTPAEGQQSQVLVRSLADFLTQFTVVRRTERQIRNTLGLDMFTIRTQVLQNALLQALNMGNTVYISENERIPEQNRNTIGNYFDNTAVFMGKYIGSDLFVQTMISLRYDQYQEQFGGLRLEPDIGLDLRTPLANVRWNMSPRHQENLFISDQSFSLIWRWTF